jgi:hypothetical protein
MIHAPDRYMEYWSNGLSEEYEGFSEPTKSLMIYFFTNGKRHFFHYSIAPLLHHSRGGSVARKGIILPRV